MRGLQVNGFVRPFLWQAERPVDEGMAMPRHIGGEDLIGQLVILPAEPVYWRGLALFQKAGLIDDLNRVLIAKRFQRVVTDHRGREGVPASALAKQSVLTARRKLSASAG